MDYIHEIRLKVRDYECDLQGIVNNANYQHYLEHARHEFLLSTGAGFAELHSRGIDPVGPHHPRLQDAPAQRRRICLQARPAQRGHQIRLPPGHLPRL